MKRYSFAHRPALPADPGLALAEAAVNGSAPPAFPGLLKRLYDIFFSAAGLILLSPLLLLIAVAVKLSDGGPLLFSQERVGLGGRRFRMLKFRTMVPNAERRGPSVTQAGDARITRVGRWLRKSKLDELPQLWHVLAGDMSLVGPRPEVPAYVRRYSAEQREILKLKPGLTDLASLCFRGEEQLLGRAQNLEEFYLRQCVPRKVKLNLNYARRASLWSDTWIILQTLCPYWAGLFTLYAALLAGAFWLSHQLTTDLDLAVPLPRDFGRQLGLCVTVQLLWLTWRKQCHGLLSYFSLPELRQSVTALGAAALVLLGLGWVTGQEWVPRNVILIDLLLSLSLLGGLRFLLRLWRERSGEPGEGGPSVPQRVAIIGAGVAGARLAQEWGRSKRSSRTVVAFFDDDPRKWHKRLHDIPVVGMPECLLEGWAGQIDEVVIAIPEGAFGRRQELEQLLRRTGLKVFALVSPLTPCPCFSVRTLSTGGSLS